MRELLLYVPRRSPPDWNDHLAPGECAVFLADVKTEAQLTADGHPKTSPGSCLVFESESAARAWSQQRVAEVERLKCDLYDRRGMASGPIVTIVNPKHARRLPNRRTAGWMIGSAIACIVVSPVLFWLDWRVRGVLILPTLVGFTLIISGLRLLQWGVSELHQARELERQVNDQNSRK